MKNAIFIIVMLIATFSVKAEDISRYVLDNYLIPLERPGVVIGHICPVPSDIRLLHDTASLFSIDVKEKSIRLKKNKSLSKNQSVYRYGVTLLIDGKECQFELVKDGFSKNKVVAHRGAWKQKGVLQNSVRSFQNAVELGCQGSELDVWLTADNKVITRVRDNILKSKEQKNIQPTKGGHKMVTCQNYVSLFYRQITSCPSDGGIS